MQSILVMFRSDGQRRSFSVTRDMTVVGRREDCDLRIPLGEVSRKHARLVRDGDTLRLEDLGSSNGTYLNGQRVQEAVLTAGDSVQIGPVVFVLQIDGMPADEDLRPITADISDQVASSPAASQRASFAPAATGGDEMDQGVDALEPLPMEEDDQDAVSHPTEDVALQPLPPATDELDFGSIEPLDEDHGDEPLAIVEDDLELAPADEDELSDKATMLRPPPPPPTVAKGPVPPRVSVPAPSPAKAAPMVPPPPLAAAASAAPPPLLPRSAPASPSTVSKTGMAPPPPLPKAPAPLDESDEEIDSFFIMDENSELDAGELGGISEAEEPLLLDESHEAGTPLSSEHENTAEAAPHLDEYSDVDLSPIPLDDAEAEPLPLSGHESGVAAHPPLEDSGELDSLPPLDDSELDPLPPLDDSELDPLPPADEHSASESPVAQRVHSEPDALPIANEHSEPEILPFLNEESKFEELPLLEEEGDLRPVSRHPNHGA